MCKWLHLLRCWLLVFAPLSAAESVPLAAYNYPMLMAEQPIAGKGHGFVVDIVTAAFVAAGREVDIHYFPTKRALHMGVAPDYAGVIGAVEQYNADELTEVLPVIVSRIELKLFHRRDNTRVPKQFRQLTDLQTLRVSAVLGSAALPLFEAAKLQYDTSPEVDNCISKLYLRRVDICAGVEIAAWEAFDRLYPGELSEFASYEQALLTYHLSVNLNRRFPGIADLQTQLEGGLRSIQRNGLYLSIARRYYGDHVPAQLFP